MIPVQIDIEDLSFAYPGQPLLDNVSFSLNHTKKTVLLAPNGAGKSTLIHILACMTQPDHGKIRVMINDQDVTKNTFYQKLGLSLSHPYLLQDFSIQENLDLFSSLHACGAPANKDYIDPVYRQSLIEMFRLDLMLDKKCKTLSQGELKKVSIVRALMHKPHVLFFDEPTNALDANSKDILAKHIKTLDALVLIASHDRAWSTEITQQTLTIAERDVHVL